MGVINTTPDSFADGGSLYQSRRLDLDLAMARAREMVGAGAAILDIGGESTRPGAAPVSVAEEMDRVLPLLERIAAELDVIVSVDTSSPELMTAAAARGAGLLNDVRALGRTGAVAAAAATGLPICLMHMRGEPGTMQQAPDYSDVVAISWPGELPSVRRGGLPGSGWRWTRALALARLSGTICCCWTACPGLLRWVCRCWWGCHANP